MSSRPQPGPRPDGGEPAEPPEVSLEKDDPAPEPFDPYRYGKPDRPIPQEYWPPGYQPDPEPPTDQQGAPPGGPYPPYPPNQPAANPWGQQPPYGGYPAPHGAPYPPAYPPPGGAYGPYAAPARPSTTKAMLAMIFGIASIVLCWLSVLDLAVIVPAIVLGIIGLNEAKRQNGAGRGMAIAGLVCAVAGAILAVTLTVLLTRAIDRCGGTSQQDDPAFNKCVQEQIF